MDTADMTPSTSTETVIPNILIAEDNAEASSSETESTSSSTSSSVANDTSVMDGQSPEQVQGRPVRFNSYPMDNTYLSPPLASSGLISSNVSASLVAPAQTAWPLSPQGSLSSVGSTPSITSASSPSHSPSSPSELSDSLRSIHQLAPGANRPSLDSVDYSYFLTRFCYYTGHDNTDRHGLNTSYGSTHRRHSLSESTMDGHSPSWEGTEAASHRRHASETTPRAGESIPDEDQSVVINDTTWVPSERPQFESPDLEGYWSGGSGHTTPTRSSTPRSGFTAISAEYGSPGKTTPRAHSPKHADVDLEQTPRPQMEYFVRPYRGSL